MIVKQEKQLLMPHNLLLPLVTVNRLQHVEGSARKIQPLPVDIVKVRSPDNSRLLNHSASSNTIPYPLENTHDFAVARRQELPNRALTEPVDMKHPRRSRQ